MVSHHLMLNELRALLHVERALMARLAKPARGRSETTLRLRLSQCRAVQSFIRSTLVARVRLSETAAVPLCTR